MGELQVETHTKRLIIDSRGRRWDNAVTMAAVHLKESTPALDDVDMGTVTWLHMDTVTWLLSIGRSRLIHALAEVEAGQRLLEGRRGDEAQASGDEERPSPAQRELDSVYDRGQAPKPSEPEPELRKTWPGEGCALDPRQADLLRRSHTRQAETIEKLLRENGLKASRIAALETDLAGAAATNASLDYQLRERLRRSHTRQAADSFEKELAQAKTDLRSQLDINRGLEEANRNLMQRSGSDSASADRGDDILPQLFRTEQLLEAERDKVKRLEAECERLGAKVRDFERQQQYTHRLERALQTEGEVAARATQALFNSNSALGTALQHLDTLVNWASQGAASAAGLLPQVEAMKEVLEASEAARLPAVRWFTDEAGKPRNHAQEAMDKVVQQPAPAEARKVAITVEERAFDPDPNAASPVSHSLTVS